MLTNSNDLALDSGIIFWYAKPGEILSLMQLFGVMLLTALFTEDHLFI
jgi:hypothetical protein